MLMTLRGITVISTWPKLNFSSHVATLYPNLLFPGFLISTNYTLFIGHTLVTHLHSSPLLLHPLYPINHQILLILLLIFSNRLLLSIPTATTPFQSHYNLPPGLLCQHPSPETSHVPFLNTFHIYGKIKVSFDPVISQLKNLSVASYYP